MSQIPEGSRPLFLVKPGTVSRRDIMRAEKGCGIVIIECADPESARYSEPPLMAKLDDQARAALSLLRMVLRKPDPAFQRSELTKFFVECLMDGKAPTPVMPVPAVKR